MADCVYMMSDMLIDTKSYGGGIIDTNGCETRPDRTNQTANITKTLVVGSVRNMVLMK